MTVIDQSYVSVGRVFNVSQEIGINVPLACRLPDRLHLLPTLIDRFKQREAICDVIEDRIKKRSFDVPIVFVLQGHKTNLHRAFLMRLEKVDFGPAGLLDDLGYESVFRSLGRCRWPSGRDHVAMLRSLVDPLNSLGHKLRRRASQEDIEYVISSISHSIGFSHHVSCENWNSDDAKQLESWLNYLHDQWPQVATQRLCIAFLCIEYDNWSTASAWAINPLFDELKRPKWQSFVHEIKPFDEINSIHVGDWVSDISNKYTRDFSEALLLRAQERLFPADGASRKLSDIYNQLFEIMWEAYRQPKRQFGT